MPEYDPKTIYQISRWADVFETAQSRRYSTLTWVAERISFLGTGWQRGLDDWGEKWLAVYGAWMVIVRVVAGNKQEFRGVLCGEKGEPFSASRIARIPGVKIEAIKECLRWAVQVGWLIPYVPGEHAANTQQTFREQSSGTLPNQTKRDQTRPDKTERNGTTREPIRADEVSKAKPGERQGVSPLSDTTSESRSDRPASVKLAQYAKSSPILQELERRPVTGSGVLWHGSVFSRDRLKPEHITTAPASFWFEWYKNQLTADSPELRCGNQAEAAFILAAVYAARRIPDAKIKASRAAVWIRWVKDRECSTITTEDFRRAVIATVEFFGGEIPEGLRATKPVAVESAVPRTLPPEQRAKPRGKKLDEAIRELKDRTNAEAASA